MFYKYIVLVLFIIIVTIVPPLICQLGCLDVKQLSNDTDVTIIRVSTTKIKINK